VSEKLQKIDPRLIEGHVRQIISSIEQIYVSNKHHALFPGKEVFRSIRGILPGSNYTDGRKMDLDLAKEIAEYQVLHKRIPKELVKIKETILNRH